MTIKELRKAVNMTQKEFSEYFGISKRNIENWETEKSNCPEYLRSLIEYKLENEGMINMTEEIRKYSLISEPIYAKAKKVNSLKDIEDTVFNCPSDRFPNEILKLVSLEEVEKYIKDKKITSSLYKSESRIGEQLYIGTLYYIEEFRFENIADFNECVEFEDFTNNDYGSDPIPFETSIFDEEE